MNDSTLEKKSQKFISELRSAVGEENVESVVQNISASKNPQFYTLSVLSNGYPSLLRNAFSMIKKCGIILPPNFQFPVKKKWLKSPNSQPFNLSNNKIFPNEYNILKHKEDKNFIIFGDILNDIHNFLSIRGNPYNSVDLVKQFNKNNPKIPKDVFNKFISENDWHAGLSPLDVFEELEDPDTKGNLSDKVDNSYTKIFYPKGYPLCSGKRPNESHYHNFDWISCEQDIKDDAKSKSANIPQVTDKMEIIEDDNNELEVLIAQNKNVYRLLLFGGPMVASFSPIVALELDHIYPGRGGLITELLNIEPKIYPIILKRVKERSKELFITKITQSVNWCKQLETALPAQRTIFRKGMIKKLRLKELTALNGQLIQYPIDQLFLLTRFYSLVKSNIQADQRDPELEDKMEVALRRVVSELRNPTKRDIHITFNHAACIYCCAFFLKEICSLDIIDDLKSPSLKTAIDIGITDPKEHGFQRFIYVLADSMNSRKFKKFNQQVSNYVLEISGLLFEIDFEKVAFTMQVANLLLRVLKNFTLESEDEAPFIICRIDNGEIMLLSSMNEIVEINL